MYSTPVIYLTPLYFGEKGVAERLKKLASAKQLTAKAMNQVLLPHARIYRTSNRRLWRWHWLIRSAS